MIHSVNQKEYRNADDSYRHCVNTILMLKGSSKKFYIGATHNPNERLEKHITIKKMKNMHLLTVCPTKLKTQHLEQKLIKRFGELKYNTNKDDYDENGNIIHGGGGEGIAYENNYIYVLLK